MAFLPWGYDSSLDVGKTISQNPTPSYYQDVVPLIAAAQTITTSYADVWFEIPCAWYKTLFLWLKITIQGATSVTIKALPKHTSAGTEEYNFVTITPWSPSTIVAETISLPVANWLYCIPFNVANGVPYIQMQAIMTDGGTDPTIDSCFYTLGY